MGRVFRIWAHLSTLRRRGQAHGIDNVLKGRQRKRSLGIPCPACPQIHINVDLETIEKAQETEA